MELALTITVKTRPDGDYYYDRDDLFDHVLGWIRQGLEDRDDIIEVIVAGADD